MDEERLRQLIAEEVPNIPADVRNDWLLPSAKHNGWPPSGLYWTGVLLMREINFWKDTTWTEEEVNLEKALWSFGTCDAIQQMHKGFFGDPTTLFGTKHERERILSIIKFLFETGTLPGKMSLLAVGDGFELADGHHRYLALIQAKNMLNAIKSMQESGREAELDPFFQSLKSKWGIETISDIPTNHVVWVSRPCESTA